MTARGLAEEFRKSNGGGSWVTNDLTWAYFVLEVVLPREIAKAVRQSREGYDPDTEPWRCGTCTGCTPNGATSNPFCWSCTGHEIRQRETR